MANFLNAQGLTTLWSRIKTVFSTKEEVADNEEVIAASLVDLNSRISLINNGNNIGFATEMIFGNSGGTNVLAFKLNNGSCYVVPMNSITEAKYNEISKFTV